MAKEKSKETLLTLNDYGFSILQIETKAICNMACKFCPYPLKEDKSSSLDDRIVYDLLDSLVIDEEFEYVCFSQFNEPLMDDRIFDFIAYAKNLGLPVLLITNGLMFSSSEIVEKLVKAEPDYVKISLQTANAESFQNVRKVKADFSQYVKNLYSYLNKVKKTSTNVNIDVACNFLSWPRKLKASLLGLDKGDPSVYGTVKDLSHDVKYFLKGWSENTEGYEYNENNIDNFLKRLNVYYIDQESYSMADNVFLKVKHFMYGKKLRDFFPIKNPEGCSNRMLGVLASGNVVPCCLLYDDMVKLGNVNDQSLGAILESKKQFLSNLKLGKSMPLVCKRCVGAPTRRGALLKTIKNGVLKL